MSEILTEAQSAAKLQELNSKVTGLKERQIKLQTLKSQTEQDLASAEQQAINEFGTSDIGEMREIYRSDVAKQSEAVLNFEKSVNQMESVISQIENELAVIDQKYA